MYTNKASLNKSVSGVAGGQNYGQSGGRKNFFFSFYLFFFGKKMNFFFFFPKTIKKASSRHDFTHPAAPPETVLFLGWPKRLFSMACVSLKRVGVSYAEKHIYDT